MQASIRTVRTIESVVKTAGHEEYRSLIFARLLIGQGQKRCVEFEVKRREKESSVMPDHFYHPWRPYRIGNIRGPFSRNIVWPCKEERRHIF